MWSRVHFQIWLYRLSSTQFHVRSVYTSSAILTAYSILIAPRRSRHVLSRRSCRADWRFAFITTVSRVAICVTYVINTWRVVQGLARRLRRYSHCKPSQAEQIRTDPIRLSAVLHTYFLYLFNYSESLIPLLRIVAILSASRRSCRVDCVALCVTYLLSNTNKGAEQFRAMWCFSAFKICTLPICSLHALCLW